MIFFLPGQDDGEYPRCNLVRTTHKHYAPIGHNPQSIRTKAFITHTYTIGSQPAEAPSSFATAPNFNPWGGPSQPPPSASLHLPSHQPQSSPSSLHPPSHHLQPVFRLLFHHPRPFGSAFPAHWLGICRTCRKVLVDECSMER